MPKRTRQHKLETESRLHFESLLPSGWVSRTITPDYGIDISVELFDSEDRATGQQFLVQLKGTDSSDAAQTRRVSLKTEWIAYYLSSPIPVLIARYHAPTRQIFINWIYDFAIPTTALSHKTVSLVMPEGSQWTTNSASQIAEELSSIQKMRSSREAGTLSFTLLYDEDRLFDNSVTGLTVALRHAASAVPQAIRFTERNDRDAVGYVHIARTGIRVRAAGQSALVFAFPPTYGAIARERLVSDVLLLVGITLDALKFPVSAAKLICVFGAESSLARSQDWIEILAASVERAGNLPQGLDFVKRLFQSDGCLDAAYAVLNRLFIESTRWTSDDWKAWKDFLLRLLSVARSSHEPARIAIAAYNVANHLRNSGVFRSAFVHYCEACKNDPSYRNRGYFIREVAGCLFELKRYTLSARYYARAIERGEDSTCIALYADALMFAGRYREAEERFERYIEAVGPDADARYQLKLWSLRVIQEILGEASQKRRTKEAQEFASSISFTEPEVAARLTEVLRLDALYGFAWHNLAVEASREDNPDASLRCFLIAALLLRSSLDAWVNAFVMAATQQPSAGFAILVARAGYLDYGEQFMQSVVAYAEMSPDQMFRSVINRLVSLILEDIKSKSEHPKVRIRT